LRVLKDFVIELDTNEILRQLKAKNSEENKRTPPSSLLDEIEDLKNFANPLIHSRAIFGVFESNKLEPKFLFNKSEKTILAICTIGKELETHVAEFLKEGKLAKGTILNAIASVAAEQTAEYINKTILQDLEEDVKDKEITCRFSPGYCQWELDKGQKTIFELLDNSKIGVSLTSSMMMNPVKSVSFAINIGDEVDKELGVRGCENCDLINCAFRRV